MDNIKLLENLQNKKKQLFQEIKKVIIGQDQIVEEIFNHKQLFSKVIIHQELPHLMVFPW